MKGKIEMSDPVAIRFPREEYKELAVRAREKGLSVGLYVRTLVVPLLKRKAV